VGIPTFFLGGINAENLTTLLKPNTITRIAVVSAITTYEDINSASAKLLAALGS
jgi:thiamine monophosphate synthase